jgi:hypothetical protein
MAVHRSVGVPPYRVRSIATLEMAKAAMDLKRRRLLAVSLEVPLRGLIKFYFLDVVSVACTVLC